MNILHLRTCPEHGTIVAIEEGRESLFWEELPITCNQEEFWGMMGEAQLIIRTCDKDLIEFTLLNV